MNSNYYRIMAEARGVADAAELIIGDRQAGDFTIGIGPLRKMCDGLRAAALKIERHEKRINEYEEASQ